MSRGHGRPHGEEREHESHHEAGANATFSSMMRGWLVEAPRVSCAAAPVVGDLLPGGIRRSRRQPKARHAL